MSDVLGQLGINGKLLLAQGVNFFILLIVLRVFVYSPLIRLLNERKKRIEKGIKDAEDAEIRLKEIEVLKEKRLAQADHDALLIVQEAQGHAKEKADELIAQGSKKAETLLLHARDAAEREREKALEELRSHAGELIKSAIIRTVELDPSQVDDALVGRAVARMKESPS